jgi:predicted nucleotidyltransferase component of viral defense system
VHSPRASVELFHLVFLRALTAKGDDKARIALKGGCNLRFFFESVRYSEDIDFDVVSITKETLRNKVDRLLSGPIVVTPLRAAGLDVSEVTAPKQTDTTQRWKVGLVVRGASVPLRTKIEFSRRSAIAGAVFEATSLALTRPYGLTPVLASHYGLRTAIVQKVHALAERTEPQVRDVFDLAHLFARPAAAQLTLSAAEKAWVLPAVERAVTMSYDDYASTVVAYLEPDHAPAFASRSAWDAMQENVVRALEALG